ncbi:hypothetical protein TNCV_1206041 [Trichonephila clavipes]|nr:hypothetical protein TNCV_1206041 [Trichonephila clavipes]
MLTTRPSRARDPGILAMVACMSLELQPELRNLRKFTRKNAMEYHSELVETFGNNALPYSTVAWWVYCVVILLHREEHIALYTTVIN